MVNKSRYYAAAIIAIVFWSLSFVGTKLSYVSFQPLTVVFLRFFIAGVILYFVRIVKKDTTPLKQKDFRILLISSLIGISAYYSFENIALDLTSASNTSLISGSYPVITAVIGVCFYGLRLNKIQIFGIILAVIGVYFLTSGGSSEGKNVLLGNTIVLLNGIFWGFYNFIIPHIDHRYSTLTITYYQTMLSLPFLLPGAIYECMKTPPAYSLTGVLALLFLAVFCSVAAYLLYNFALRGIKGSTAASIMNLIPLFGLIFSALILHEAVHLVAVIGGLIVIIGVVLSSR